jgi:hypothetical protein
MMIDLIDDLIYSLLPSPLNRLTIFGTVHSNTEQVDLPFDLYLIDNHPEKHQEENQLDCHVLHIENHSIENTEELHSMDHDKYIDH